MNQKDLDRTRKTFRLSFPVDLTTDQAIEWLRTISGTLRGSRWRFKAVPSIVLEVFATQNGIQHRLKVPYGHEPYVIKQLRLKGINADPETQFDDRNWSKGVELRMTQPARQLWIASHADTASSILVNFQSLDADEALMLQIVFTPAGMVTLPVHGESDSGNKKSPSTLSLLVPTKTPTRDDTNDRREKLTEPNMLVAIRIVAHASTEAKADKLVRDVEAAYYARCAPSTQFKRRWFIEIDRLRELVKQAATPGKFVIKLSAPELVALSGWPFGGPFISGLAPTMTRHMPAAASIPMEGRVIGTATFQGNQRPVAMPYKHAVRHMHVLGPNGTGKTTLLANMMVQDMERGYGVILIETKGDLFVEAVGRIPTGRLNDVIIIDVNDDEMPIGFNILDQDSNRSHIGEIISTIEALYSDTARSLTAPKVLYHALHALAEVPGHTFVDLAALLETHPSASPIALWQNWIAGQVKNQEVKLWLKDFMDKSKAERDREAGPVKNRTWEFTNRPEIRRIFGQRKSSFKMTDVILQNKILLVNLAGRDMDPQSAMIAGTLFANLVKQAAWSVGKNCAKPNFLWVDEFQDIARFPIGLEAMLAKARGFNLGTVLAHQHTGQLTPAMRDAVMANTATKVVFQTTADDARVMARNFQLKDTDFMNLMRYQAIAKVATDTGMSPPVTVATKGPGRLTENERKARLFSRNQYGRPLEDVERDIDNRPGGFVADEPRPRPPISGHGHFGG